MTVVAGLVVMADFVGVVTDLADTVVADVEITGRVGAIGEVITDDDHSIGVGAHTVAMRLVTDNTGIAVGTGIGSDGRMAVVIVGALGMAVLTPGVGRNGVILCPAIAFRIDLQTLIELY